MSTMLFDKLLARGVRAGQLPARSKEARDWYRGKALDMRKSRVTPEKIEKMSARKQSKLLIGEMYFFAYDPKHKDTLPYYDKFPLIFPIEKVEGGFMGINVHYLPPTLRARLMDALYDTVTNKKFDDMTRLRLSYDILANAAKFKLFRPTIKRYLTSHMRSKFIKVEASEWDIALMLPVAQFQKASNRKVWADSRKLIGK